MKKLIIIFHILCIRILQVTARKHRLPPNYYEQFRINYTDHDRNYTQEVDYKSSDGHKTYILSKNESHVFVNSTDEYFTPCVMPFKNLSYGFQTTLLNNKTIILWDLQTESFNVVGMTLLLINPQDCNYKSLDVPADVIPKNQSPYKPQVLTYNSKDHFDIFYGGRQACMPCRFTNQGEKIIMDHQLTTITNQIARPYLIQRYGEKGLNITYLLIYSFYNGSLRTAVNKLDDHFNVLEKKLVDHPIDAIATGQHGVAVCYKLEYHKKHAQETDVYCDHYLTDFRRIRHTKLDIPRYEYVNEIAIKVNSLGSLCVAVPHISYERQGNKYSLTFFQYANWDSKDRYGPNSHLENNVDDESGSHLKTRTLKSIREHCG